MRTAICHLLLAAFSFSTVTSVAVTTNEKELMREFGRLQYPDTINTSKLKPKRHENVQLKKVTAINALLEDELRWLENSLPVSMSMKTLPQKSYSLPTVKPTTTAPTLLTTKPTTSASPFKSKPTFEPTSAVTTPPTTAGPTNATPSTLMPENTPEPSEILSDFPSSLPSITPTLVKTEEPTRNFKPKFVFTCTDDGVDVVKPPFGAFTVVSMNVGYIVESSASITEYQKAIEDKIMGVAIVAALQCNDGGPVFGDNGTVPNITMDTVYLFDECIPETPNSGCAVMETGFQMALDKVVLDEKAAFLGYVGLQAEMNGGAFAESIPAVDRVEYISPLPLFKHAIPIEDDFFAPEEIEAQAGVITASRWTISAVLAMCVGGVVAILVWVRDHRTRRGHHARLLEDSPSIAPVEAPIENPQDA